MSRVYARLGSGGVWHHKTGWDRANTGVLTPCGRLLANPELRSGMPDERLCKTCFRGSVNQAKPPLGTKLVLMSDSLMDIMARTAGGAPVTWEWGEPDEHGWYSPTFTEHNADPKPEGLA